MVLSVMGLYLLYRKDFSEGEISLWTGLSAGMTDRPVTEDRELACVRSQPVKSTGKRKRVETEPKPQYVLSYQLKEQRAQHCPFPACFSVQFLPFSEQDITCANCATCLYGMGA